MMFRYFLGPPSVGTLSRAPWRLGLGLPMTSNIKGPLFKDPLNALHSAGPIEKPYLPPYFSPYRPVQVCFMLLFYLINHILFFAAPTSICNYAYFCTFLCYCLSPASLKDPWSKETCLLSPFYTQHEAHRTYSINMCWRNKWENEWMDWCLTQKSISWPRSDSWVPQFCVQLPEKASLPRFPETCQIQHNQSEIHHLPFPLKSLSPPAALSRCKYHLV